MKPPKKRYMLYVVAQPLRDENLKAFISYYYFFMSALLLWYFSKRADKKIKQNQKRDKCFQGFHLGCPTSIAVNHYLHCYGLPNPDLTSDALK